MTDTIALPGVSGLAVRRRDDGIGNPLSRSIW
jgi:hypothetical protein